ncbi:hypothetical protein [Janthinobacterium fluminis]|uniref:Uncharacterized protein n=1 Tax=Janthinobacterium fluminis TaxID=2987524 RepID=A0ABT5JVS2_9BURK|nr:hypothetical protein [Janthinobacterium fluminis]MDC8756268.1 hypothetical protein [Janthinobacterium fluminis]
MTVGVRFSTVRGERQLDENFMVPEFIGKIVLSPVPVVTEMHPESPYTSYTYSGVLPQAAGRAIMIFWTLPSTTEDIWIHPDHVYFWHGSDATTTTVRIFRPRSLASSELPEGYAFALDKALPSSDQFCMRLWDEKGRLIFDSGHEHLNMHSVLSDISMPEDGVGEMRIFVPEKPAFLIPAVAQTTVTSNRPWVYVRIEERLGCARRSGGMLYSSLVKSEDFPFYFSDENPRYPEPTYYSKNFGLTMPVINAAIYD